MALAANDDINVSITIAAAVKRAEEIHHTLQDRLARQIRNEIVEALDGKKN